MSDMLRIFRKDLVQSGARAAVIAAFVASLAWMDAGLPSSNSSPYPLLLDLVFLLACFYLAASLIQADGPASDCPYWVTRPFPATSLLAAKLLALAVCLNLPVFVAQSCVLAANGLSPFDHLSILLWRQVFFTAYVVLPAAALAAVTRSFGWFAAGTLLYLAIFSLPQWAVPQASLWLGWEWIRLSAAALVSLAAAAHVLWWQFRRRTTEASRMVLGSAAVVIALAQFLPWHTGFAIQNALAHGPAKAPLILFAPARGPVPAASGAQSESGAVAVAIAFDISGLGADQGARLEGVRTAIEAPGRHWDSGWGVAGQRALTGAGTPPSAILAADGTYWLPLLLPRGFYDAVQPTPAHLRVSFALTLLADSTSAELELGGARIANDTGVCWSNGGGALLEVVCSSPFWNVARARLRVRSRSTGESVAHDLRPAGGGRAGTYAAYPTAAGLSLWTNPISVALNAPPLPIEMVLETHPAAGFAERTVDIPSIRLSAWRMPPE
jgi:hypothetical protein